MITEETNDIQKIKKDLRKKIWIQLKLNRNFKSVDIFYQHFFTAIYSSSHSFKTTA